MNTHTVRAVIVLSTAAVICTLLWMLAKTEEYRAAPQVACINSGGSPRGGWFGITHCNRKGHDR